MTDTDVKIDVAGFAALSLGLVFTSTCNGEAIEAIIQALMMRGELELSSPFAKFLALGLGLLFLGKQDAVEPTVEVHRTLTYCCELVCSGCSCLLNFAFSTVSFQAYLALAHCDHGHWRAFLCSFCCLKKLVPFGVFCCAFCKHHAGWTVHRWS